MPMAMCMTVCGSMIERMAMGSIPIATEQNMTVLGTKTSKVDSELRHGQTTQNTKGSIL